MATVTLKSFLTVFQQERARDAIRVAIREGLPPLSLLQKVILDHFGRDLTDGELASAGKAVRVVAESLGHPHLRYNVPFSVPGAQHASGSTYVN